MAAILDLVNFHRFNELDFFFLEVILMYEFIGWLKKLKVLFFSFITKWFVIII